LEAYCLLAPIMGDGGRFFREGTIVLRNVLLPVITR
jgi:hypothetical protein